MRAHSVSRIFSAHGHFHRPVRLDWRGDYSCGAGRGCRDSGAFRINSKNAVFFFLFPLSCPFIGMAGLSYLSSYAALNDFSVDFRFLPDGCRPLIFQFGTEVAYPVPEGTFTVC